MSRQMLSVLLAALAVAAPVWNPPLAGASATLQYFFPMQSTLVRSVAWIVAETRPTFCFWTSVISRSAGDCLSQLTVPDTTAVPVLGLTVTLASIATAAVRYSVNS